MKILAIVASGIMGEKLKKQKKQIPDASQHAGIGTVAAVSSAVGTLVAAMIAAVGIHVSAEDAIERSRPLVQVEFRTYREVTGYIELVVSNVGETAARNVHVDFEGGLTVDPAAEMPEPAHAIKERYVEKALPTLFPDQELTNIWWMSENHINRVGLPGDVTVEVKYEGANGRKYEDSFDLSKTVVQHDQYLPMISGDPGTHSVADLIARALVEQGLISPDELSEVARARTGLAEEWERSDNS